jgi:hypothetical protein
MWLPINQQEAAANDLQNNYNCSEIRLYEGPSKGVQYSERNYTTTFPREYTRYIYTEVRFDISGNKTDESVDIDFEYLYPDRTRMFFVRQCVDVKSDWNYFICSEGDGVPNPGMGWNRTGIYTANIYLNNELVKTIEFYVCHSKIVE